jgi:hypothetical protein
MAAPSYTTDLATITDGSTGFTEPTGALVGTLAAGETDFFIQGTNCTSKSVGNSPGLGGAGYPAAGVTIASPNATMTWVYFGAPNALQNIATGGLQIICGQDLSNYYRWFIAGSDTYTYGGWLCVPVDPNTTRDGTAQGTPNGTWQYFGAINYTAAAVSKGNPFGVDAIRHGRCTLQSVSGDLANGYATFVGASAQNDNISNRWGILQSVGGGYLFQGHFLMGTSGTAVDFRDTNRNITINNTTKVSSTFNLFEIRNASSRVDWTGITISSLSTVSRGNFLVTNNATINLVNCAFNDMGTFTLLGATSVSGTAFRRCQLVTYGGGTLLNCLFDAPSVATSTPALLWNQSVDPNSKLDGTSFVSGAAGHGIEFGPNTPSSITLKDVKNSGYGADASNNAFIYNNSGKALTINVQGTSSAVTYKNGSGASTSIVTATVTLTISGLRENSDVWIYRVSDNTQLHSANPATTTDVLVGGIQYYKTSWTYSAATYGGVPVYVRIYCLGYINQKISYTLASADATLPIQQVVDRNYNNPA